MIALRDGVAADAPALADLAQRAFVSAFGAFTSPENMATFFAASRSAEAFGASICDPAQAVTVATEQGKLAGYCLIEFGRAFAERPAPQPHRPVYLSQLYCAPDALGGGIGGELLNRAIGQARAWGADAIQLSVWSENYGAQRFYQRRGFVNVADIHFWVGDQRDDEFLYELAL